MKFIKNIFYIFQILSFLGQLSSCGKVANLSESAGQSGGEYVAITFQDVTLDAAKVRTPYKDVLKISGGRSPFAYKLVEGVLPVGIELEESTGILFGTPDDAEEGKSSTFSVTVLDASGIQDKRNFTIAVQAEANVAPLMLTASPLSPASVDTPYKESISMSGGVAPFTFRIVDGALPLGLILNPSNGIISGTAQSSSIKGSEASFSIEVVDSRNHKSERTYNLKLAPYAVRVAPTKSAVVIPTIQFFMRFEAIGAAPPVKYSLAGRLPEKLQFSSDGVLATVSPHVASSDAQTEWVVEVTATDANGVVGKSEVTVDVGSPPTNSSVLAIQTLAFAPMVAGTNYYSGITSTGGVSPLSFSLESGTLPSGLSLDPSSGLISGNIAVNAASTSYAVVIKVSDSLGSTANKIYSGTIAAGSSTLSLLSTSISKPIAGGEYSSILAIGGGVIPYTFSIESGLLPNGLTLGASSGMVSGTVLNSAAGTNYLFTIKVVDSVGQTVTRTYSGSVGSVSSPLTIQNSILPTLTAGAQYSAGISVMGGIAPLAFSIQSGALPSGLSLDSSNGMISGYLNYGQAGSSFVVTIKVEDAGGQSASKTYLGTLISGAPPLSITTLSLTAPSAGTAYAGLISISGGAPPYIYSLTSGSLPSGLVMSGSNGSIVGTPVYASAGTSYVFTVSISDGSNQSVSKSYSGTIGSSSAALAIATTSIPPPTAGSEYLSSIAAIGGLAPYSFSVSSGSLPPGLSLNSSNGLLSGISSFPSRNSPFIFTVSVTDSAAHSAFMTYSGFIGDYSLGLVPLTITPAIPGSLYSSTISTYGGQSPYNYALTAGSLPVGVSLNAVTGVISGTVPDSESGVSRSITIKVTDINGASSTRVFNYTTASFDITLQAIALSTAVEGQPYSNQSIALSATGGTGPYTYEYSGNLPTGIGLSSSGSFFGTPVASTGSLPSGTAYSFQIRVRDSQNRVSTASVKSLIVAISQPVVVNDVPTGAVLGTPYSYSFASSGGRPPYSYSMLSGAPPTGITVSSQGNAVGTPTGSVSCPAGQFTLTSTDSLGQISLPSTKCITTVNGISITNTTFPSVVVGQSYSGTVAVAGGTPPYVFSAANLPSGLTINSGTGVISGFINDPVGDYTSYILVRDSSSPSYLTVARSFGFKVRSALSFSTMVLPKAASDRTFGPVSLPVSGGLAPYNFTVSSGSLPTGISLTSGGSLSGTPSTIATTQSPFTFGITVADSSGQISTEKMFTIAVSVPPKIITKRLPNAFVGNNYFTQVQFVGGVNPFLSASNIVSQLSWSSTGLPTGLSIDSQSGRISGVPLSTVGSPFAISVTLADANGMSTTKSMSLKVTSSGSQLELKSARMSEPCPQIAAQNCDPRAFKIAKLLPTSQPNTNYAVYAGNIAGGTIASPNSRIYISKLDTAGRIDIPGLTNNVGVFTPSVQAYIPSLDIADIDNDGFPDIAFADYTNNQIVVVWNTGTTNAFGIPIFTSSSAFSMPAGGTANNRPYTIKVANSRPDAINGNKKDILVTDWSFVTAASNSARVAVFLASTACSINCSGTRSTVYSGPGASITSYATSLLNAPGQSLWHVYNIDLGYFNVPSGATVCPSLVFTGRQSTTNLNDWVYLRHQTFTSGVCTGIFNTHNLSDEKLISSSGLLAGGIAVKDFNADGISDLAITLENATTSSANLKVLLMPGSNNFPLNALSPLLPSINGVTVGAAKVSAYCLDGSNTCTNPGLLVIGGRNSAYTAANSYGFISIIPNLGSPNFFEDNTGVNRIDYAAPNGVSASPSIQPLISASGSLNDVAIMGSENSGLPFLYVLARNGSSQSEPFKQSAPLRSFPDVFNSIAEVGTVRLADMDLDGKADLLAHLVRQTGVSEHVGDLTSNSFSALPSSVYNTMGVNQDYPYTWHVQNSMDAADINNDGFPDVVTIGYYSRGVSIALGDGTSSLDSPILYDTGTGSDIRPTGVVISDLDSDGFPDIVAINLNVTGTTTSTLSWLKGRGDGTFNSSTNLFTNNGIGCSDPRSIAAVDLDADGRPEIAVLCYASQALYILRRHSNGTWVRQTNPTINIAGGSNGVALRIGHLTSSNGFDLVIGGLDHINSFRIISNITLSVPDSSGNFSVAGSLSAYQPLYGYLSDIEIADLDNDSLGDIVFSMQTGNSTSTSAGQILYTCKMLSQGICTREGWGGEGTNGTGLAVDDLDNDGRIDIVQGFKSNPRLIYKMISRILNISP